MIANGAMPLKIRSGDFLPVETECVLTCFCTHQRRAREGRREEEEKIAGRRNVKRGFYERLPLFAGSFLVPHANLVKVNTCSQFADITHARFVTRFFFAI